MTSPDRRLPRLVALVARSVAAALVVVSVCLTISACGGSSPATGTTTAASAHSQASPSAVTTAPAGPAGSGHYTRVPSSTGRPAPAASHSSPTAASAALRHAFQSFATCLSINGVKLRAGTGSGSSSAFSLEGVDTKSPAYRRALKACIPLVDAALKAATKARPAPASSSGAPAPPGHPAAGSTAAAPPRLPPGAVPASVTATMKRFTACMRTHGISAFPEPAGASFDLTGTHLDTHTPQYKTAEAHCTTILQALDPRG